MSGHADDKTFYTFHQAARLARIRLRRLRRWIQLGVVTPSRHIVGSDGHLIAEGFSLQDVGYLHLLRHLTDKGIPLEDAVQFLRHLLLRFGPPGPTWKDARIGARPGIGRGGASSHLVLASSPDEWAETLAIPGSDGAGQRIWSELVDILPDTVSLETILVPADYLQHVEISERANGLPLVRGTNVHTSVVHDLLKSMDLPALIRDYFPHISEAAAAAADAFEGELDRAA
jgi:hypothetical protein